MKSLLRVRKLGTLVFAGVMTAAAALICVGGDYGMAKETAARRADAAWGRRK